MWLDYQRHFWRRRKEIVFESVFTNVVDQVEIGIDKVVVIIIIIAIGIIGVKMILCK